MMDLTDIEFECLTTCFWQSNAMGLSGKLHAFSADPETGRTRQARNVFGMVMPEG
jgi:hypothetical protein